MTINTLAPTIQDRLQEIDPYSARRYAKLNGTASNIAIEGIIRHLAACARNDVPADFRAVREIIDDALNGRSVYAEVV